MTSQATKLRTLLSQDTCHALPCCWDALSAKMIADAGFESSFMSGFAVSAARIGEPDTGLISFGEMLDQGRNICAATSIPIIGDGDTGYGNALNVRRTVEMYARAGFAAVMIEDQLAPKRCGHTKGKLVVERAEAMDRIKAAVDTREAGADIMILARTDARHGHGLDEAIERAKAFSGIGADILFIEAPQSQDEMARLTQEAPGIHMANIVEGGATPMLNPSELRQLGYGFAIYPLTLLSSSMKAIADALRAFRAGKHPADMVMDFKDLRKIVGFDDYYDSEKAYSDSRD